MLTMTEPRTMTEPCTMPEEQLTATQQTAITSLILGNTVSEAAGEAGVHRNTVHRWLKTDEPFQAARHRAQRDARSAVEAKLHDTAMAAVDCLEKCLLEGDAYVAEQLLKGLGCFDGKLKNLGKEEAVELALEALQHSATSDMFRGERAVGPGLPGQLDPASVPDPMAARNHVPTDEMSGQARTYEVPPTAPSDDALPERYQSVMTMPEDLALQGDNLQHDATSNGLEAKSDPGVEWAPGVGWTDNVDSSFNDNPRWLIGGSEKPPAMTNLQPIATFQETEHDEVDRNPKRQRGMDDGRSGTPVPDEDSASGTGCDDLRAEAASRQAQPDLREVPHDATSEEAGGDVYTVECAGDTCEIRGYADLSTQQTVAMFALQTGQTIDEAAASAETEPAIVTQWLRGDDTFQAAMNRCAGERRQSVQSRLAQLASQAADVIDRKVHQGNGRVAVKLLKGLGYLGVRRV